MRFACLPNLERTKSNTFASSTHGTKSFPANRQPNRGHYCVVCSDIWNAISHFLSYSGCFPFYSPLSSPVNFQQKNHTMLNCKGSSHFLWSPLNDFHATSFLGPALTITSTMASTVASLLAKRILWFELNKSCNDWGRWSTQCRLNPLESTCKPRVYLNFISNLWLCNHQMLLA